jgi:hypothetical protein
MFGACRQPAGAPQQVSSQTDAITKDAFDVSLAVNAAGNPHAATAPTAAVNSRTIAPDWSKASFYSYELTIVKNGSGIVEGYDKCKLPENAKGNSDVPGASTKWSIPLKLHAGVYAVTVNAYTKIGENDKVLAATATVPLNVTSTGATSCDITLKPIEYSDTFTGTLSWNFKVKKDVVGTITVDGAKIAEFKNVDTATGTASVLAGCHNLRLTFAKSNDSVEMVPLEEECYIYAGLITEANYDYSNIVPVSGTVKVENSNKTPTSAIVVTAYQSNGSPFEPPVTRSFPAPDYTGADYKLPYTLAIPKVNEVTVKASFAEPSDAYILTATDVTAEVNQTKGATNVNPVLHLDSDTITVKGAVTVENPANINYGDVTVTATAYKKSPKVLAQAKAIKTNSDLINCAVTYEYTLSLPPTAVDTKPDIRVTLGAYIPSAPDGVITKAYELPDKLTAKGIPDGADFGIRLYGLTTDDINDNNNNLLAAYVANRAHDVTTDTIYLWGKLRSGDLGKLRDAIGDKRLRLDMTHSSIIDGTISADAFRACSGLESVAIAKNVESISETAFQDCIHLQSITVDKLSHSYKSMGGVLYTADEATIIAYPAASPNRVTYVVPNTVTRIADGAFANATSLKSVTMGDNVRDIGKDVFRDCTSLQGMAFTESVNTIGEDAFNGCSSLSYITVNRGMSEIGARAFSGCNLSKVVLPDTLGTLGVSCFANNRRLSSATFGVYFHVLPDGVFTNCDFSSFAMPNTITSVGKEAFKGNANLANLTMNNGLETIGDSAFDGCALLAPINIPNSVTAIGNRAFNGCLQVDSGKKQVISIGTSVATIGDYAFEGCKVKNIDIPSSVKRVGDAAFKNCSIVEQIVLHDGLDKIGKEAFYKCLNKGDPDIVIPNSVTEIGEGAFADCKELNNFTIGTGVTAIPARMLAECVSLEDVVIPSSVRSIGDKAFYDCAHTFDTVVIPGSVETIGASAFEKCGYLYKITIESGVETIGDRAFAEAGTKHRIGAFNTDPPLTGHGAPVDNLDTIVIPNTVEKIGNEAFMDCKYLFNITISEGVQEIGDSAFKNCYGHDCDWEEFAQNIGRDLFDTARSITVNPLRIPGSVTSIGKGAFDGCKYMKSLVIHNSAFTEISAEAFRDCENMENIDLGANVTTIGDLAFSGCKSLKEINLSNKVTSIGEESFAYCEKAETVTLPMPAGSIIGSDAFLGDEGVLKVNIGEGLPTTCLPARFDHYYIANHKANGTYTRKNNKDGTPWNFEPVTE